MTIPFCPQSFRNGAVAIEDGWIQVKGDGTIPAGIAGAKAGEWEYRINSGESFDSKDSVKSMEILGWFLRSPDYLHIVAVRLVQKKQYPACKGKNCGCTDGRSHSEECVAEHEEPTRMPTETIQRQLNRAAYLRYKAAHPDPLPAPPAIGQNAIEGAIFAALCNSFRR